MSQKTFCWARTRRVCRSLFCAWLATILVIPSGSALGQAPTQEAKLTAAQQERLRERDQLWEQAQSLHTGGKTAEAIAAAEQMLAVEREVFGPEHGDIVGSLEWLAQLHAERQDFEAARRRGEERLALSKRLYGDADWRVTNARLDLDHLERLAALRPEDRQRVQEAQRLIAEVEALSAEGKRREALEPCRQALAIRKELLGEDHPHYGAALGWLGWLYFSLGDFAQAEPLMRLAVEVHQRRCGEEHPVVAHDITNLGRLYREMGDDARAEPLFVKALEIRRKTLGEHSAEYAYSLSDVAGLYERQGLYGKAEPFYLQALEITKHALGENHAHYATSLNNLGVLYSAMEDYRRAESLYRQALAIRRKVLGENHPQYAISLGNLATLYQSTGDYAQAERLLQQSLEIGKKTWGENHPSYATGLSNLGSLYRAKREYARVEPLMRQAAEIRKQALGEKHPDYALSLHNLASFFEDQRDYAQAEMLYRQAAEIRKQALGERHPHYLSSLQALVRALRERADVDVRREEFSAARQACAEALEIAEHTPDEAPWRIADIRRQLAHIDQLEKMERGDRLRLAEVQRLLKHAMELREQHKLREALAPTQQALDLHKQVLGEEHWIAADSLHIVAFLHKQLAEFETAEALNLRALEIRTKVLGAEHPDTIDTLHNLGGLYETLGDLARAESFFRRALELRKKTTGERSLEYANTLNSLAIVSDALGRHDQCEALYRESVRLRKEAVGEADPQYADGLINLAFFYSSVGDHAKAEPLLLQAVTIYRNALGDKHPDLARGLDYLATLYVRMGDYARAEPLYQQALAIRGQTLGEDHREYAITLNNLAILYKTTGDYAKAEPYYRRAVDIERRVLGETHPTYALTLANLAVLYDAIGDHAQAEPLLEQVRAIREQKLGKDHPDYAESLHHIALHYVRKSEPEEARRLNAEALQIMGRHFDRTAAAQSERQQLAFRTHARKHVNLYLTLTADLDAPADEMYAQALAWKSPVSLMQHILRQRRASDQDGSSSVAQLLTELEEATRLLAARSRAAPDPNAPVPLRQELAELSERIERLQQSLAASSAEFRRTMADQRQTQVEIRQSLPADAVLVDYVEYARFTPEPQGAGEDSWTLHLAAFVVRKEGPIQRIELGPQETIAQTIDAWRRLYGRATTDRDLGAELRRRLWEPLPASVQEAPVVLISPSGALSRFPFAALPGKAPGTYLIEEHALALVPLPQLLPELLRETPSEPQQPSLLVVGDIDFDAAPGAPSTAGLARSAPQTRSLEGAAVWSPLPGAAPEADAVKSAFQQFYPTGVVTDLRQASPTETAVRQQAPRHRYLHFATHGYFFAPPQKTSAPADRDRDDGATDDGAHAGALNVTGLHPDLLSGLVLAGANQPFDPARDDGVLTALEAAALDLGNVDLVTLSACETLLGEYAGGEGLLGLQRALQTAGARSVVSSLWKVSDRGTQLLMQRFYDNLWRKKMSRLESLREAQVWMLREVAQQPDVLRGLEALPEEDASPTANQPLPPYYWAAFVLSGDWR